MSSKLSYKGRSLLVCLFKMGKPEAKNNATEWKSAKLCALAARQSVPGLRMRGGREMRRRVRIFACNPV